MNIMIQNSNHLLDDLKLYPFQEAIFFGDSLERSMNGTIIKNSLPNPET